MTYETIQPIFNVVHVLRVDGIIRVGSIFIWDSILSLLYQRVSLSGSRNVSGEHFDASVCTIVCLALEVSLDCALISNPAQGCIVHRVNFH